MQSYLESWEETARRISDQRLMPYTAKPDISFFVFSPLIASPIYVQVIHVHAMYSYTFVAVETFAIQHRDAEVHLPDITRYILDLCMVCCHGMRNEAGFSSIELEIWQLRG